MNMNLSGIKTKLTEFINADKFDVYQDLQPAVKNSTPGTVQLINGIFNDVANQVLALIESNNYTDAAVKELLLQAIPRIDKESLDTEDHEFAYELIAVLSQITGVSIQEEMSMDKQVAKSVDTLLDMLKKAGLNPKDFGL